MTTNSFFSLFIVFPLIFFIIIMSSNAQDTIFNVVDYGAVGDGQTDDTYAFKVAWGSACSSIETHNSLAMYVPSGMTFLVHPLQLYGPCKSQEINVEINGEVIATEEPSDWICGEDECATWIHFNGVDGLSTYGNGTINGQGYKWWHDGFRQRPTALTISNSKNVHLSGLRFKDNPRMHIVFDHSTYVTVSDIVIDAPQDSPNTDGIHITHSTHVSIHNCVIGTGDDCISIVDGSSFIKIRNIDCGPGHGISIGSLGKNGATHKVENVEVSDVVFTKTQNGARIKTWQGGSGYARNILYERITSQESDYPIIIDQYYCDKTECVVQEEAVQVENVTFRQVAGTTWQKIAVKLNCSTSVPCKDIVIDSVNILNWDDKDNASVVCNSAEGRVQGQNVPDISYCLA